MAKFYKWLLFISSYAPLYLLLALNNYKFDKTIIENYKEAISTTHKMTFWIVIISLFIISLITVYVLKHISLNQRRKFQGLKPINDSILSYIITYVVPLTVIDIDSVNSMVVNLVLFMIVGIIYVNNDLLYLNILLIFIGFRVYADNDDNKIITNIEKNELKELTNANMDMLYREVAKGVYLIRK
ncbi:hypothetical protein CU633_05870 [Bacillus sp. V3-13]|uniref:hypothetical protein n=1 Tax=Bacillus sp. V3-13 TaxID=2053728 RepID=UPI000C759EE0|nr:hypothetical protein [Bacillus sp. V3-13]PLR78335.1 hypothetical protein CU633_05870 [Bacillus sp. V3-13]